MWIQLKAEIGAWVEVKRAADADLDRVKRSVIVRDLVEADGGGLSPEVRRRPRSLMCWRGVQPRGEKTSPELDVPAGGSAPRCVCVGGWANLDVCRE